MPPLLMVTRAAIAARFERVRMRRNDAGWLGLGTCCMKREGGSPTLRTRMSMLPSFLTSPKAAPRRQAIGTEESPDATVISSKVRLPLFRNKNIGCQYFELLLTMVSTWG